MRCISGPGSPGPACVGWPVSEVICQGLLFRPGAPRVCTERCPQGQFRQQRGAAGGMTPVAEKPGGCVEGCLVGEGRLAARVHECHGTWKGSGA